MVGVRRGFAEGSPYIMSLIGSHALRVRPCVPSSIAVTVPWRQLVAQVDSLTPHINGVFNGAGLYAWTYDEGDDRTALSTFEESISETVAVEISTSLTLWMSSIILDRCSQTPLIPKSRSDTDFMHVSHGLGGYCKDLPIKLSQFS